MEKKPKRVLHILYSLNRGGAETLVINILRNFDTSKLIFDFLLFYPSESSYEKEVVTRGSKIHKLPYLTQVGHFSFLKMLKNFFIENPYEIIHSHLNEIGGLLVKAAKDANANTYCIVHSHNTPHLSLSRKIYKLLMQKYIRSNTDQLFACSKDAENWLLSGNNLIPHKILHNGIPLSQYQELNQLDRIRLRKEYHFEEQDIVICHIGSFTPQKNHSFLLDIFKELTIISSKYKLLLIGKGVIEEEIKKKANTLKITDSITFAGEKPNIPQQLFASDLFIFPSLFEGLGIVLIEAQAANLESFIPKHLPEEIDMGINKINRISLKEDAKTWAKKISTLKTDSLQKIDLNSLNQIQTNGYNINSTSKYLEKFYQSI